jgi:hypothetical protein
MADTLTIDPAVVIEGAGKTSGVQWVIYRNILNGRRWKVEGDCDQRGNCWVGAINAPKGPGGRPKTTIDIVITPEFALDGCCPFTYTQLTAASGV